MSVHPAKVQISRGICPVWSESSLSAWRKLGSSATHWAHSEDWSDWADAQADQSLRWAHSHFVGFVMSWLKCNLLCTIRNIIPMPPIHPDSSVPLFQSRIASTVVPKNDKQNKAIKWIVINKWKKKIVLCDNTVLNVWTRIKESFVLDVGISFILLFNK